ncbi:Inner membrane protein ypdA, partial [Dysosmobacter welbionis]
AAAAPNDDQQNDDPAAVAAAKAVIAHTGTSYEIVDRPNRSQSIVCRTGKGVPVLFPAAGDECVGRLFLPHGEDALVHQRVSQCLPAAGHRGIQRVVGDVCEIRTEERAALQGGQLALRDDAIGQGIGQCAGEVLVVRGAVSQCPEDELHVLAGCHRLAGPEGGGGVSVGVALAVCVAHVFLALGPGGDVREGSGAGVGQRIILLAQDADEHDEGLQAGRGDLQVISISVAGEAALKQVHGLERDSNGVVVRVGGVAEGVGALIIHNRRLGGDG